jgi:large subunit ribosomal protein L19
MNMNLINKIEADGIKTEVPVFYPGDTVRVHVKIREGEKERIQIFQGVVLRRRGGGMGETFTVYKLSSGIGVERVFPLHSPNIPTIERVRTGKVRRAKLYYMRGRVGRQSRIQEKKVDRAKSTKAEDKKSGTKPESDE